jgi:predicted Rossmann-fold nucleotide-binding protein
VIFPGGFGTLDEMFEALTLIQTEKMPYFPVVVIGTEYWKEMVDLVKDMDKFKTVSQEDLNLFLVTDDLDEALNFIQEKVALMPRKKSVFHKKWWLGER